MGIPTIPQNRIIVGSKIYLDQLRIEVTNIDVVNGENVYTLHDHTHGDTMRVKRREDGYLVPTED